MDIIIDHTPIMSSNTSPAPYIVSADACYSDYRIYGPLNNNNGIWWTEMNPPEGGHWWKINLGINNNQCINRISWNAILSTGSYYSIKNFIIWGSNDDINYNQLYSGINPNNGNKYTYDFSNNNKYRYYKFTFPGGDYTEVYNGFSNLKLLEVKKPKFLIQDSNKIKVTTDGINLTDLGNTYNETIFNQYGMDDLSLLNSTVLNKTENNVYKILMQKK